MRTKSADLLVILFFFLLGLFSFQKVYLEPYLTESVSSSNTVALLNQIGKTVKKKPRLNLGWRDAHKGDPLSNGDQVFTYENSNAEIQFLNGTNITLLEKTLFFIQSNSEKEVIDLRKGSFIANFSNKKKELIFRLNGKDYVLKGQNAQVQITKGKKKSQISVLKGKVEIKERGKKEESFENKILSIDENGQTQIKPIKILLQSPIDTEVITFVESSKINFNWEYLESLDGLKLFISKDPNFNFSDREINLESTQTSIQVSNLEAGHYYWKIAPLSDSLAPINSFSLLEKNPPIIFSPQKNETFPNNKYEVDLLWESIPDARYEIQLKNLTTNKTETIQTEENEIQRKLDGPYAFRVRPIIKNQIQDWSDWRRFEVKKPIAPPMPKILAPKDGSQFIYYSDNPSPLSIEVTGENKLQHILEINQKEEIQFTGNQYIWSPREEGRFTLRIKSFVEKNIFSPYSKSINISFIKGINAELSPEQGSEIVLDKPNQEVDFTWKGERNGRYLIEVSKTKSFSSSIIKEEVSRSNFKGVIGDKGTFYWRVKEIQIDGSFRFSKPARIKITPSKAPPPIKLPSQKIKIRIKKIKSSFLEKILNSLIPIAHANDTFADINWPKGENAKGYRIQIYKDESLKELVLDKEVIENQFNWLNPPSGKFYWRIAILDHWNRLGGWSNTAELEMKLEIIPQKQKFMAQIKPKHNYLMKEEFITFEWEKVLVNDYILLLSEKLEFKDPFVKKNLKKNSITFKRKEHWPKSFYWKVVAENKQFKFQTKRRRVKLSKPKTTSPSPLAKTPKIFPSPRRESSIFSFFLSPSKMSLDQSSTFTVDISGTAINSVDLSYTSKDKNWYGELKRSSGKVFETESINSLAVNLSKRFYSLSNSLSLFAGALVSQDSYYTKATPTNLSAQSKTSFGALAQIQSTNHLSAKTQFQLIGDISFGTLLYFQAKGLFHYKWNQKTDLSFGGRFTRKSYKEGSAEVSLSSIGLLTGLSYHF